MHLDSTPQACHDFAKSSPSLDQPGRDVVGSPLQAPQGVDRLLRLSLFLPKPRVIVAEARAISYRRPMFSLLFERNHRVLLTRFAGIFRREVIEAQMVAARRIEAIEGPTRALYDFHDVETVDIPYATLSAIGQLPQTVPNQLRVYVMPRPELFGMGRVFAAYQDFAGNREPVIYRTMAEAYAALELKDPDFQPVQP